MSIENNRQAREGVMVTSFHELPPDIIRKVLQHLSLTERFRVASTCRAWHRFHLDGLVSIDIRKSIDSKDFQAGVERLGPLISRSWSTLCSLTIHLRCGCVCDDEDDCQCKLPFITFLPRKCPQPVSLTVEAVSQYAHPTHPI